MTTPIRSATDTPMTVDDQFSRAQRPTGLVEQVYEQTCDALLLGRYSPGSRLNIRQLAAVMHVSATPVREALSRLISEGILEASDTRAIVVPQVSVERLLEIFELRVLLEGELAYAAATAMSAAQVAQVRELQAELEAALDEKNYREVLRCNAQFHFAIYKAANRPLALQIVRGLWLRIGPTLHLNYPLLAETREGTTRHHTAIDAILARDPGALRAGIIADVRGSQHTIFEVMQRTVSARSRARLDTMVP
jgi:DNA-binding GntR family transcriptional regulator